MRRRGSQKDTAIYIQGPHSPKLYTHNFRLVKVEDWACCTCCVYQQEGEKRNKADSVQHHARPCLCSSLRRSFVCALTNKAFLKIRVWS
ncbi:hypothetical protein ACRRTK_022092 [Alexandromys fortis]